ncbi:MAG TPA: hypothetical protein VK933_17640 [Longimicrobiales bacterium]|nr:hypothetical protein [Longimicrobiales bacterium]
MSTAQWLNIGDDPGALHALVERISEHVPVAAIDYLWIFPARRIAIGESIVVVIGAFDEDPERRRVSTAHFTVSRNRKGAATVNARFDEHGSAPVAAVPRIVQGVLRRLGEDTEASPREEQIDGEQDRWDALIVELGGPPRTESPAEDIDGSGSGADGASGAGSAPAHDAAPDGPHDAARAFEATDEPSRTGPADDPPPASEPTEDLSPADPVDDAPPARDADRQE